MTILNEGLDSASRGRELLPQNCFFHLNTLMSTHDDDNAYGSTTELIVSVLYGRRPLFVAEVCSL